MTTQLFGLGELRAITGMEVILAGTKYSIETRRAGTPYHIEYGIKMDTDLLELPFENKAVRIFRATSLFVVMRLMGLTIMFGPYRMYLVIDRYYHGKVQLSEYFKCYN